MRGVPFPQTKIPPAVIMTLITFTELYQENKSTKKIIRALLYTEKKWGQITTESLVEIFSLTNKYQAEHS